MTEPGATYRISDPGKGFRRHANGPPRIVVSFDPETFDEIRKRAVAAGTSFAEQVRLLTEWGLEEANEDAISP